MKTGKRERRERERGLSLPEHRSQEGRREGKKAQPQRFIVFKQIRCTRRSCTHSLALALPPPTPNSLTALHPLPSHNSSEQPSHNTAITELITSHHILSHVMPCHAMPISSPLITDMSGTCRLTLKCVGVSVR
jgi:hypothetical protein